MDTHVLDAFESLVIQQQQRREHASDDMHWATGANGEPIVDGVAHDDGSTIGAVSESVAYATTCVVRVVHHAIVVQWNTQSATQPVQLKEVADWPVGDGH